VSLREVMFVIFVKLFVIYSRVYNYLLTGFWMLGYGEGEIYCS